MLKKWQEQTHRMEVSDNFYFPGNVPYDLAPYYINSFDICVAPWDEEQVGSVGLSPMKLFDYLACGRPIVTSSIYGVREIIEKERIGTTVDVRDKKNFAVALARILENSAKYEKMAIKGREIIIQHYTWKRTAEQIEKLCRNELK
jgi:glycosyltransferase involved in cell wall biosynthesis